MKRLHLFAANLALLLPAGSLAAADRVGLVIGCGKYRAGGISELSTPVNDARKVAAALRAGPVSFDVVEAADSTRNQFFEKLAEFKTRARGAKVVLVYFSGHGIEADGVNYLIPIDAVLEKPSHLDAEAIPFSTILTTMQSTGAEAKVAVLDACRNNPFGQTKSWRDSGKSISEGVLAALGDAQLPEATLVCFAASPGRKAAAVLNDSSENSPFTEFLLKRLGTPGARLRDIFESTADDVAQATKRRQLPYVKYDGAASVLRQLILAPATTAPVAMSAPPGEVAKLTVPAVASVSAPLQNGVSAFVVATKEAPFVNSLGMKFVPVGGTKVLFCIWETRVQDYEVFVKDTGREWPKPIFRQGPTHPAVNFMWEEAVAFCRWLSKKEGREYRLATDAEWSVAVGLKAESGSTPREKDSKAVGYPWGTAWPPPRRVGNFDPALKADEFERTSPVGTFSANGFGLYDLSGNVWEWCSDLYDARQESFVLRGGSFLDNDENMLRSSYRLNVPRTFRSDVSGFRCVLVISGG